MALRLIEHGAPPAIAVASGGSLRAVAGRIGHATAVLPAALCLPAAPGGLPGRVQASDPWRDGALHAALGDALGVPLSAALRPDFEWYFCRAAFFHNDAHYGDVIFGIWCVAGNADLVFPRARCRLPAVPGAIALFDPFEVHGVLAPGAAEFEAERSEAGELSMFIGFELDLTLAVRAAFGVEAVAPGGRTIGSSTRISPRDGSFV
jgi:hypothetical protein